MSGNLVYKKSKTIKTNSNPRAVKTPKQMERHLKGVANHRRIEILFLVAREGGISVEGIADSLKCNFKTISVHIGKLTQAGLIEKRYEGRLVKHSLTPYGRIFISFLTTFQHS